MILIGRGIRWYNNYQSEVDFCKKHGFDFMQIWFKDGDICINDIPKPKEQYIKEVGFPVILHAVFSPEDFEAYGDRLLEIVEFLNMNEVIIHPVCDKTNVPSNIEHLLTEKVKSFSKKAKSKNITWYLENNSVIDLFHYNPADIKTVFDADSYVEQLLDVAHIDNYQNLKQIVDVKFPKCLHVAGKHFDVKHEHLPLTQGDIDYNFVFSNFLHGFKGRVILEIDGTDEEIIQSKGIIDQAITFAE